ncbi:type 2 isopentenyl-diphosphate Delta-isomerase [Candidatus Micrarchaeota archaeon]|nr:MAG: type 2 isopentenyl-diphosphate Delta-isomerase [Candidatus Micrarchaeota archaeon]
MPDSGSETKKRKAEHVELSLKTDVGYGKSTGFEDVEFIHHALPELDFDKLDTRSKLFNKPISAPFIISSMTGGYQGAEKINRALAKAAQEMGVGMGLGSQRAMIESNELASSYNVRKEAPDIPLFGNIGIYQLKKYSPEKIEDAVSKIEADALAVHLNPLQEIVQPEGDRNFSSCLKALEKLCSKLSVPVIAKEVGAGISGKVAKMLEDAGVKYIDVSGAGGTSWSAVEIRRGSRHREYWNWGIPTAVAVADSAKHSSLPLIVSGGVRNGLDVAKGIALGASYGAAAHPFLKAVSEKGVKGAVSELKYWRDSLKIAMFLTGSSNLKQLSNSRLLILGKTAESFELLGLKPAGYASR